MFKSKHAFLCISIAIAAPALFSFCEREQDLKTKPADCCPNDFVVSPDQSGRGGCYVVVHDNDCHELRLPIACDKVDDLRDSPPQAQSQMIRSMLKAASGQAVPVGSQGAPAVTVSTAPNAVVQSLQHLLGFSIDVFSSTPTPSTVTCSPNLNYYAVEHLLGTVAHEFPCATPPFPRIQVAQNPLQVAVTPDSTELWVTSYYNGITVINTSTDKVLANIATDSSVFPNGIAISPDGTRVYITSFIDYAPALVTYDRATRMPIATLAIPTEYPQSVFLSPDGSTAIVTHPLDNIMWVVDTLSNSVIGGHPISQPYGVAFSPNGTKAYISSWPNSLVIMDMTTLKILGTYNVGSEPIDVVASANGRWVSTVNYADGTVSEVNTFTGAVTTVNVGGNPHGISLIN